MGSWIGPRPERNFTKATKRWFLYFAVILSTENQQPFWHLIKLEHLIALKQDDEECSNLASPLFTIQVIILSTLHIPIHCIVAVILNCKQLSIY